MAGRKQEIINKLIECQEAMTANQLASLLNLDRSNVSRYLNELNKEGLVSKSEGRPVRYQINQHKMVDHPSFDKLIGYNTSLKNVIQKAKAAILYPPRGLHTLLFGETGTGKSLFAECMYYYAKSSGMLENDAPFISFNCADYAQNPQLLFAHIFGVRKGAFTGADKDSDGLVAQADGGILFLDEIHRLPPEGQEMLFTFIDKGEYRPLGESQEVHTASVQIIGATTESSTNFLTTFNRRIPMTIELPPLRERTIEERFEIATYFLQREANRLKVPITVSRDVILSLMAYPVDANVGQVKRDVKLICAKAFLQYQSQGNETDVFIHQKDLPVTIQKGLLLIKQQNNKINELISNLKTEITFLPGSQTVELYPKENIKDKNSFIECWPSENQLSYFEQYVDELQEVFNQQNNIQEQYIQLSKKLYEISEDKLERTYDERAHFAFAMHLQIMFERIENKEYIKHPDLNYIRKQYLKEFQVAMDLSQYIEEHTEFSLSMDEIGFMTMFLALPEQEHPTINSNQVKVFVLMHGHQTAKCILQTAQELLQNQNGVAFDMPLQKDVLDIYKDVFNYIKEENYSSNDSILLLADMGSLTKFGEMLEKDLGIKTRTIPMVSTSIVMEALRLSAQSYSLEEIYQSLLESMTTMLEQQVIPLNTNKPKAVVVTCFTGEGVATKIEEHLQTIIDIDEYEIIKMQFLEHSTFRRHIDDVRKKYEIKAIVGTVAIHYQNIPYFSVIDIFDNKQIELFKRVLEDEIPIDNLIAPLKETVKKISDIPLLLKRIRKQLHNIQNDLSIFVESNIEAGIVLHIAFLVDKLLIQNKNDVNFKNLEQFKHQNKLAFDVVTTQLLALERYYQISLSEDDRAFITQMIIQNRIDSEYVKPILLNI